MTPELCRGSQIRLVAIQNHLNIKTDTSGLGSLSVVLSRRPTL